MKAEIISVGSELLLGQIVNTDAQFLSIELAKLGIDVFYHVVVGDNTQRLKDALNRALNRSDMVLTTGGLGPTTDDITKETITDFLNLKLVPHQESIQHIEQYFKKSNREMPKNNYKQGLFPIEAQILYNACGTAPGAIFPINEQHIIMLPGPPRECQSMYLNEVKPFLMQFTQSAIKSKVIRIFGIGESKVQELISDLLIKQTNPTIAPLAKNNEVTLRLTTKCNLDTNPEKIFLPIQKKIEKRLGHAIYGFNNDTLASVVVTQLINNHQTISLAESCTGGLIGKLITDIPGSSKIFLQGVIVYSNQAKQQLLQVNEQTLKTYGAVSAETAAEMVDGLEKNTATDFSISVTGIAGPDGGSEDKPVGLVYIGFKFKQNIKTYKFIFNGTREQVREQAALNALNIVRLHI